MRNQDMDGAARELRAAAELEAGDGRSAVIRLAEIHLRTGEPSVAKERLLEIVEDSPDEIEAWRLLAGLYLDEGDRANARQAIKEVLARSPRDPTALLLRAEISLGDGRYDRAITAFEKVLAVRPDLLPAVAGLGRALLLEGDLARAQSLLERAVNAGSSGALADLADVFLRTERPELAVVELNRLLALMPDHSRGIMLLGLAHLQAGDVAAAARAHRRLIELHPDDARAHFLLGVDLRVSGEFVGALTEFESSCRLAPDKLDALGQMVEVLFELERYDEAVERVEQLVRSQSESYGHYFLQADVCQRVRRWQCAEAAYRRAIELAEDPWRARLGLAFVQARRGEIEAAASTLSKMSRERPEEDAPLLLLAQLHSEAGDPAAARRAYQAFVARKPEHAAANNNLAVLLTNDGELDRARAFAELAYGAAPHDPHVADTLGWTLVLLGQTERGLAHLLRSVAALPDDAAVCYHLGIAYARLGGREAEARAHLERALQLGDGFVGADDARRALAELP